jgi:hypothetical protein
MLKMLKKKPRNPDLIQQKYLEMYKNLMEIPEQAESLSTQRSQASSSVSAPVMMGDFRRIFAQVS